MSEIRVDALEAAVREFNLMTTKKWLWVAVVAILVYAHLLVGTIVAIATAFYWLVEKHQKSQQPWQRLSDTKEIQLAFQQGMQTVFAEAAGAPIKLRTTPAGIVNAANLMKELNDELLKDALRKPELVKVMKTLIFLLAQCSRLEATKQNVKIFELLFRFGRPITPTIADAFETVIHNVAAEAIEPKYAQVK